MPLEFIIIIEIMIATLLCLLFFQTASSAISASLTIIQFEPIVFQLSFSEPIIFPQFQLILNNAYLLNYTRQTIQDSSNTFYFEADARSLPNGQILEKYEVMFNQPLAIGNGRLPSQYFRLNAVKEGMEVEQPEAWGYMLIAAGYMLISFGFFGVILIEFLEVYCLINFKTRTHTTIYHNISDGLLMLNPNLSETSPQFSKVLIFMPALIIILMGFVGFLAKRRVGERESIMKKIIYEYFVHDIFICISLVFLLPSFFNSTYYFSLEQQGSSIDAGFTVPGSILAYLGIATPFAVVYLFLYVLNPKPKQSQQSWLQYLESEQFQSFRRLHSILKAERWYTRNQNVMMAMKLLVVACLYFLPTGFQFSIFILEFINIFFIFMVQPYKEEIYMNIVTVCRLLMLIYYGVKVLGVLYYSMDPVLINYSTIKPFLLGSDILFLLICLCLIVAIFYEIYIKCSHLNYQVRLVREENQIKLKIIERRETQEVAEKDKINEKNVSETSQTYYDRDKFFADSPEKRSRDQTQLRRPTKAINLTESKKKSNEKELLGSIMLKPGQTKVVDLELRKHAKTIASLDSKKDKAKWKKESLLVQILKEQ